MFTCDQIILSDNGNSTVSLPEIPLLAVLPGTGGLTRVTDKRKVRRDRADAFCTIEEGITGPASEIHGPTPVEVLALMDTGCNGDLYMHLPDAKSHGIVWTGQDNTAVVAGGVVRKVEHVTATVDWLGQERRVRLTLDLAGTLSPP